ncbi:MAG: hypothetical protein A2Y03_06670 [Omnitrophica WOR_2 bacterium GWF2_38_59]|nr:MAG: hypothetical protein A2Y03_06670 [Omnitrophica WOR_2 bacterium GWF2_38_59]OGX50466.1 MAG: hypothetical protein A2243_01905 [Omnitrophica WOR_2 bacterium RIFOXYA2_FULL_38_17]OGX54536.1 MAG: hypothetical protein A2267_04585 [Omnitrophica WOR_2 bacterium RIFOXYA12_FULL_38_10]OGX59475.1 MAG: hypothetical protein A2306_09530 [Omnitrophica WOR_2 bacterium RIFOXYB2_FULL_38_16]HBG62059.1 hypothetical protein [Candidatus Omnitrophota bacterium]
MQRQARQDLIIEEILKSISKSRNLEYMILDKPDIKERNVPACDMIVQIGSEKWAIEHTSIDSIPKQRRDDNRVLKLLFPLRDMLRNKLPVPGHYDLNVDMNVIPTGINWDELRESIALWCINVAPLLKLGSPKTTPSHYRKEKPLGVPFELALYRWPGRDGVFNIGRFAPTDLEEQRALVILETLNSRGVKVVQYKEEGFKTLLILEANDIALANQALISEAFEKVASQLSKDELPDEVYLIETDCQEHFIWCLKSGDQIIPDQI